MHVTTLIRRCLDKAVFLNNGFLTMRVLVKSICLVCAGSLFICYAGKLEPAKGARVSVIPISEMVDFGLCAFIKRAVDSSIKNGATHVVFDIDTFGGLLDSSFEISRKITEARGKVKTIAYVSKKAISAGAFIALSCEDMVMRVDATIGDCAPIAQCGGEGCDKGPKMLGEKYQSPVRAEFRKLAQLNGYPELLAEAMVSDTTEAIEVSFKDGTKRYMTTTMIEELPQADKDAILSKRTIVEKGKLLTISAQEAVTYGFADAVVKDMEDLKRGFFPGASFNEIEQTWAEKLVRMLDKAAPLFFFIGILALYSEFKVPGFGLPGVVAILCFGAIFVSKYFVGLAEYTELILFAAGVLLLGAEIFVVPGFGITGIGGIMLIALSLYLAAQSFVIPKYPWQWESAGRFFMQFGLSASFALAGIILLNKLLPRTSFYSRIALSGAQKKADGYAAHDTVELAEGSVGTAQSVLRPVGRGLFNGVSREVMTQGEYIQKGTSIEIVKVGQGKIIVSELKAQNTEKKV